jgi:hypothetical protein
MNAINHLPLFTKKTSLLYKRTIISSQTIDSRVPKPKLHKRKYILLIDAVIGFFFFYCVRFHFSGMSTNSREAFTWSIKTKASMCNVRYSLQALLFIANVDISKHILVLCDVPRHILVLC